MNLILQNWSLLLDKCSLWLGDWLLWLVVASSSCFGILRMRALNRARLGSSAKFRILGHWHTWPIEGRWSDTHVGSERICLLWQVILILEDVYSISIGLATKIGEIQFVLGLIRVHLRGRSGLWSLRCSLFDILGFSILTILSRDISSAWNKSISSWNEVSSILRWFKRSLRFWGEFTLLVFTQILSQLIDCFNLRGLKAGEVWSVSGKCLDFWLCSARKRLEGWDWRRCINWNLACFDWINLLSLLVVHHGLLIQYFQLTVQLWVSGLDIFTVSVNLLELLWEVR